MAWPSRSPFFFPSPLMVLGKKFSMKSGMFKKAVLLDFGSEKKAEERELCHFDPAGVAALEVIAPPCTPFLRAIPTRIHQWPRAT